MRAYISLVIIAALSLQGCGHKGPLTPPAPKAGASTPPVPAVPTSTQPTQP